MVFCNLFSFGHAVVLFIHLSVLLFVFCLFVYDCNLLEVFGNLFCFWHAVVFFIHLLVLLFVFCLFVYDYISLWFFVLGFYLLGMCCTPRAIDVKPRKMVAKWSCRDCWVGRLGKVLMHTNCALHMYVCTSTPAPRSSQKILHDTFVFLKTHHFSLF